MQNIITFFYFDFGVKCDLVISVDKTPRGGYAKMLEMNSRNRLAYCSG